MINIPVLTKKEFTSFFYSPIAYVVLTVFLIIQGYTFWLVVGILNTPGAQTGGNVMEIFFGGTFFYWFSILVIAPVITMKSFSEEKKSGTIEMLMTAPVTDWEVVLAKFLGTLGFFISLWLPTFLYVYELTQYNISVDLGPIISGYLGTFLIGSVLVSIGIFCSALTKNQIIAAIVSFTILLAIFSIGFVNFFISQTTVKELISYISFLTHFDDFARGIIDTKHIIYYLSLTIFTLFITVKVVEARKWK